MPRSKVESKLSPGTRVIILAVLAITVARGLL
jgi:hypothetical protein